MWHDYNITKRWWLAAMLVLIIAAFYILLYKTHADVRGKTVVCIPVYGQSLALGEEAERITDFDEFIATTHGRVVTQDIDTRFGYFDLSDTKQFFKKLFHHRKRAFELSVYGMSESLTSQLGSDTLICTFPGGQGATAIASLSKGTPPYNRFIADIKTACQQAIDGGAASFSVPAVCWMQGESDIADHPGTDYRALLLKFRDDINCDIQDITHQKEDVRLIVYQPNALSRSYDFNANSYDCPETSVPQVFVDILRNDTLFWASGPTYPYPCVGEKIHIDGPSQKRIGYLEARSALAILRGGERITGLLPTSISAGDSDIVVTFTVPCPPLAFDTVQVSKASCFGFSVINADGEDIAKNATIEGDSVRITCSAPPTGCRVRYAVNGESMKSGCLHGPRGNLRDSQGIHATTTIAGVSYPLHNWCYQFDQRVE